MHGHRLVVEATQSCQRDSLDEGGFGGDRYLKAVPVVSGQRLIRSVYRFLARNPCIPRCGATRAVSQRTRQAQERALQPTLPRVVHERRGSTKAGITTSPRVVHQISVSFLVEQLIVPTKRTMPPRSSSADLVIAHENCQAIGPWKCGHPVMGIRDKETVCHRLSGARDDLIRKALREIDDSVRVAQERAELVNP